MTRPLLVAALVLAACMVAGCEVDSSLREDPATHELRIYEVPPHRAEVIARVLGKVLDTGAESGSGGRVSSGSGGQLLVSAPPRTHQDVATVLASMLEGEGDVPYGVARLEVWIVEDGGTDATADPRLAAIEPALEQLRQHAGLQQPVLVDRMSTVVALPDGEGMVQSAAGNTMSFLLRPGAAGPLASFELSHRVEDASGQRGTYGASTDYLPVKLGQWLVLHHFILADVDGAARSRSVIVRIDSVDSGS